MKVITSGARGLKICSI